jgi:Transposase IS66 family
LPPKASISTGSTLAFWVGYAAAELMPPYERLKANLLMSAKLAVDETPERQAYQQLRAGDRPVRAASRRYPRNFFILPGAQPRMETH